jgi:hypothetical protein
LKLVPDAHHLNAIQHAVASTHKATILATELLNIHMRRMLVDDPNFNFLCFFNSSWILNAYNEVTSGKQNLSNPELRKTLEMYMPPFSRPDRTGIQQCLLYDCRNLATVAANGVWMHFHKRVLSHVRCVLSLDTDDYAALSKDERKHRKLELMQIASDMCRSPSDAYQSPNNRHDWIVSERARLGIDNAVGEWKDKPLVWHLKAYPHRFVRILTIMSSEKETNGSKAFSIYPLRRTYIPRHVRFDQKALRDLLGIGKSEYIKERTKKKQKISIGDVDGRPFNKPKRRTKEEMEEENRKLFGGILDLRAANIARKQYFDYAFTTDGIGARLQMRTKSKTKTNTEVKLSSMPKRGIWAINELRRVSRLEQLHVVGIDPGKRELVVGVDTDAPRNAKVVRYTQKQRLRDVRSRQYADEASRSKPRSVQKAETELAGFHSRTTDLVRFCAYCTKRHETLELCLAFYSNISFRKRRWKKAIKTQQSEERLYKRIESIQKKDDIRQLVLAYGSWGMVAGRTGACNRGNPPCIGVGLMRKLATRFVVAPTPEAYTSKTCCRCLGACGPWKEKETEMKKKIRGLRRCTQRDCMLPLNRDRNGATNIGTNFKRLFDGGDPIRCMSDEDLAFHRASLCIDCD